MLQYGYIDSDSQLEFRYEQYRSAAAVASPRSRARRWLARLAPGLIVLALALYIRE
jgi:hypothetical protein